MKKIKFKFVKDIKFKVIIIVILTTLASSISSFLIVFMMTHNVINQNLRDHAAVINEYTRKFISADIFNESISNKNEIRKQLNQIRETANLKYLYTATKNLKGQLIYHLDGFLLSDPNIRKCGELIEDKLSRALEKCLLGSIVREGIYNTNLGHVYVTFWPVFDNNKNVVGAIGMEFNIDNVYESYRSAILISIILSVLMLIFFIYVLHLILQRVSEPFYKKLAYTDWLTQLPNRLAFELFLEELTQYPNNKKTITIIVFDVNNLKIINDTLGHESGDLYIKSSSRFIDKSFRYLGKTYRIGGDEFATVILDNIEVEIQKILDQLYDTQNTIVKNTPFNCAYGMASFDSNIDKNLHDVLNRADEKMYEFKRCQKSTFFKLW